VNNSQYVSVALCTYNGSKYIEEQIKSILNQTRPVDEIIICDDGSKDTTVNIASRMLSNSKCDKVIEINEKNFGTSKNFEKAISLCNGDIIFLCDQDDIWMPLKVERVLKVFENKPQVGLIFSDAELVDSSLHNLGATLWRTVGVSKRFIRLIDTGHAVDVLLHHTVVTGATCAFRSKYTSKILPIPCEWVHDSWIAFIISAYASITAIPEKLILYRQHSSQQIGAKLKQESIEIMTGSKKRDYLRLINELRLAYKRLSDDKQEIDEKLLWLIAEKIEHVKKRTDMPRGWAARTKIIAEETITGRYCKFSSGIFSILKDLFSHS